MNFKKVIKAYGDDIFKANGQGLQCKVCDMKVCEDKKTQIIQHLRTALHIKGHFNKELTEALISVDIPL